jgi:hypothetical protein
MSKINDLSLSTSSIESFNSRNSNTPRNTDIDPVVGIFNGLLYEKIFPRIIKGLMKDKDIEIDADTLLEWTNIHKNEVLCICNGRTEKNKNYFPKSRSGNRGRPSNRSVRVKCEAKLERNPNKGQQCSMTAVAGEHYCSNHLKKYKKREAAKMKHPSPNINFSPPIIMNKDDVHIPKPLNDPIPLPNKKSPPKKKGKSEAEDLPVLENFY